VNRFTATATIAGPNPPRGPNVGPEPISRYPAPGDVIISRSVDVTVLPPDGDRLAAER
jgi:hypothetical protein